MATGADLDRTSDPEVIEEDQTAPVEEESTPLTVETTTDPGAAETGETPTPDQQNGEPGTDTPDDETGTETPDDESDPQLLTDDQHNTDETIVQDVTSAPQGDEFGDKGSEGKYWTVELIRPPGAGPGLAAYIAMAEAAIQTAVDLLGRGMPTPPPQVDDLLATKIHETLGKGEAEKAYQQTLTDVEARQTSLLVMDNQVIDTAIVVGAEQDQTLRSIINVVDQLNNSLGAIGSAELKPAQEVELMDLVASAVDIVYDKVAKVSELNTEMAGDSGSDSDAKPGPGGGGVPGGGQAGAGGGAGDGGLGSMLPMLAMLPMGLMPLAGMLPDLLDPEGEDEQGEGEQGDGQPPSEEAPQTIDPTAPPGDAPTTEDADSGESPDQESEGAPPGSPDVQA